MTERLEGRTSVLAGLEAGARAFEVVLVSRSADEEKLAEVRAAARRRGVAVKEVDDSELEALTQARSHGGVVALAGAKPLMTAEELYARLETMKPAPFLPLIEGADDVRNLGYVLRTAEALGAHAVLVRRRAWDVDATALSRASSGSYERLPIVLVDRDLAVLHELKRRRLKLVCCVPRARDSIHAVDLTVPLILAVGGEKRGLSGAVRDLCDRFACIPTVGGPTSLAMTQAAAIVLAETARQRRLA